MPYECTVKFTAGAYSTNTVRGCRGSSTADETTAVERLGRRLLGERYERAELIERSEGCVSRWRVIERVEAA